MFQNVIFMPQLLYTFIITVDGDDREQDVFESTDARRGVRNDDRTTELFPQFKLFLGLNAKTFVSTRLVVFLGDKDLVAARRNLRYIFYLYNFTNTAITFQFHYYLQLHQSFP